MRDVGRTGTMIAVKVDGDTAQSRNLRRTSVIPQKNRNESRAEVKMSAKEHDQLVRMTAAAEELLRELHLKLQRVKITPR